MKGTRTFRGLDRAIYRLMHRRLRTRRLDPIMVAASHAGTKNVIWFAIAAVLALFGGRRGRRTALITVGATLSAQALANIVLKNVFRRKRPYRSSRLRSVLLVKPPREHSWPSGHAASSAAGAAVLGNAYPTMSLPLALLAAVISYSRVYVGVHYPFDVASGIAVGVGAGEAWARAAHTGQRA